MRPAWLNCGTLPSPLRIGVDQPAQLSARGLSAAPGAACGADQQQMPRLAGARLTVLYCRRPPISTVAAGHRDNALVAGLRRSGRRGRSTRPTSRRDPPGSSELIDDLRSLTAAAAEHGIDIALDFAVQYSADRPWLTSLPEWFRRRSPTAALKPAPRCRWRCRDVATASSWESGLAGLWRGAARDHARWSRRAAVQMFLVDNPRKPFEFWSVADRSDPRAAT